MAIQNSLMIMEGKYGGGFFVKFIQDEGTAYGWLNFTIVYPDGSYKTLQLYKNCFKETDTESSNGVWIKPKDFLKGIGSHWRIDENAPTGAENFFSMSAYTTPKMPIPERDIWKKILENFEKIPIVKISQTANIEQLIAEIQDWAEENSKVYGQDFINSDKECYITSEAFRDIVEKNGWSFSKARIEMDLMGLFVKDNVRNGYQKSKRVGNEIKRFYVIRKDILTEAKPPELLKEVGYTINYKTATDKTIEYLRGQVNKYTDMYNDLAEKSGLDPVFL